MQGYTNFGLPKLTSFLVFLYLLGSVYFYSIFFLNMNFFEEIGVQFYFLFIK